MNQRSSIRKAQSKQRNNETKVLEEETRRMESKLEELKKQMEIQKSHRVQKTETGSRWKQSQTNTSLRGYGAKLLEDQKSMFKKNGITSVMMATKRSMPNQTQEIKSETKESVGVVTAPTENTEQLPVFYDLASKFGKAKVTVQKIITQDSVNKLLETLGLMQYLELFESNHIYDIELISKDVLEEMGIPPGHRIKILKKVNEAKEEIGGTVREGEQEVEKGDTGREGGVEGEGEREVESDEEQSERKGDSSIFDGEYDQQQNAKEFQQAVLAFRKVHQQIEQIQIALQTEQLTYTLQPSPTTKLACFGCFRSFLTQPYSINDRKFCSQICLRKYKITIQDQCPKCQRVFNRLQGFPHKGVRYCRIECSPEARNIQEYFIKWRMEDKQEQSNN